MMLPPFDPRSPAPPERLASPGGFNAKLPGTKVLMFSSAREGDRSLRLFVAAGAVKPPSDLT